MAINNLAYFGPAVFCTVAAMTCALAGFWCQTVKFVPVSNSNTSAAVQDALEPVEFGLWYRQETSVSNVNDYIVVRNVCVSFASDSDIDREWKTARAMVATSLLIGGLMSIALWLVPCASFMTDTHWKLCIFLLLLCTAFQGITFLFLNSDACSDSSIALDGLSDNVQSWYSDECEWSDGMTANVVATVFWFLTAVMMMYLQHPPRPRTPPTTTETQQVTYEQTPVGNGQDGYAVTETTVVKGEAVLTTGPGAANPGTWTSTTTPAVTE